MRIEHPRTLTEIVTERLRNAIIEGQYGFGENVSEDKLASAFGVSRTPVRDALSALQFTGLVTVRPKRGSFVFTPTIEEVTELCEYRLMLEREALTMAMATGKKALVAELDRLLKKMEAAQDDGDAYAYARLDTEFHGSFFRHCQNGLVRRAFDLAEARIATIRTALTAPFKERRDASYGEHVEIVDCLRRDDLAALEPVLSEHIKRTRVVAINSLSTAER
ncbi:GntR family transcriptional regulator [Rhodobacterales bacterium]|nr:GntR family transcriptional regulator [Rhodobacterales bacterium]